VRPVSAPALPLSQARFEGALDTTFEVKPAGSEHAPFAMRLVEVTARPAPRGSEQFAVLFIGPASPVMQQGTYRFAHATLGEVDLFMVPVGRSKTGVEYEVCISRDARDSTE
jgi:hypothetical protein